MKLCIIKSAYDLRFKGELDHKKVQNIQNKHEIIGI